MREYLMSVYQPAGDPPPPAVLDGIRRDLDVLHRDLEAAGAWVFAGGLHPASTATVVDGRGSDAVTTDGPYVESKEYMGGFWVLEAPDLDAAIDLARRGSAACKGKVEVRPFQDDV